VYLNISEHRKGTAEIRNKRQEMVYLHSALTLNGVSSTGSSSG